MYLWIEWEDGNAWWIRMDGEEAIVACFKVLYRHSSEVTEENYE
jgi:hypothetical protein